MSLYDFFFPEQAQASHLRTLASQNRRNQRDQTLQTRSLERAEERIEALENDLGFVALALGSLMAKLDIRVLRGMQH